MKNKKTRSYNSIVRQKQAEETKKRITDAAEELIKAHGYEQTTIGAIAKQAGVATQTVYAIFNSKQGILTHILRRSLAEVKMDVDFKSIIESENASTVAKVVAEVTTKYGQEQLSTFNSLGGFELLYPELYQLIHEASQSRRESIEQGINASLAHKGLKLSPIKRKTLVDIMWAFTDNHLYYSLVVAAGWSVSRYEKLFHKIMEMVMTDLAPGMLESIDE